MVGQYPFPGQDGFIPLSGYPGAAGQPVTPYQPYVQPGQAWPGQVGYPQQGQYYRQTSAYPSPTPGYHMPSVPTPTGPQITPTYPTYTYEQPTYQPPIIEIPTWEYDEYEEEYAPGWEYDEDYDQDYVVGLEPGLEYEEEYAEEPYSQFIETTPFPDFAEFSIDYFDFEDSYLKNYFLSTFNKYKNFLSEERDKIRNLDFALFNLSNFIEFLNTEILEIEGMVSYYQGFSQEGFSELEVSLNIAKEKELIRNLLENAKADLGLANRQKNRLLDEYKKILDKLHNELANKFVDLFATMEKSISAQKSRDRKKPVLENKKLSIEEKYDRLMEISEEEMDEANAKIDSCINDLKKELVLCGLFKVIRGAVAGAKGLLRTKRILKSGLSKVAEGFVEGIITESTFYKFASGHADYDAASSKLGSLHRIKLGRLRGIKVKISDLDSTIDAFHSLFNDIIEDIANTQQHIDDKSSERDKETRKIDSKIAILEARIRELKLRAINIQLVAMVKRRSRKD